VGSAATGRGGVQKEIRAPQGGALIRRG